MLDHEPQILAARLAAFAAPHTGIDRDPIEGEAIVVSDGDWPALRSNLEFQRLTGLAVAAMNVGVLRLPSWAMDELLESHRRAMGWALAVERRALRVCTALTEEGIDAVILKGPAFAHRFYPDPSWRPFGDLDLLVRTADLARAGAVLERLGFNRTLPEPRAGFDRRFGSGAVYRMSGGIEIDVHRTLVTGPFGLWMRPEDLFASTAELWLGGRALRRLDDTGSFLHACVHAALGALPSLLLPLRDVAQIAYTGDPDWERVVALAGRWRLRAVIAHALGVASEVLGVPPPPQALPLLESGSPRRERRALLAYTTDRQRRGARALSTIRAIPRLRAKAAYVMALGFPSRGFLAARQGSDRGSYVRRWTVPFRWLTRKP